VSTARSNGFQLSDCFLVVLRMTLISDEELIERAKSVVRPRKIRHGSVGDVGCALVTDKGSVYVGVCVDVPSGMGFCAEHSAVAAMVTHGEFVIRKIVAVVNDGEPIPPCGRCREFMRQVHERNSETEARNRSVKLKELLPFPWDAKV